MTSAARWVGAAGILSGLLAAVAICEPALAQEDWDQCQWRADDWSEEEEGTVLHGVNGQCGDLELTLERMVLDGDGMVGWGQPGVARTGELELTADELHLETSRMWAPSGCLAGREGLMVRCCGADIELTPEQWSLASATCTFATGASYQVRQVSGNAREIRFSRPTILNPLSLPYPVASLDGLGRSWGFTLPAIGFRSDRGAAIRQDFYWPLGHQADLDHGLWAETAGAIGLMTHFRLARAHGAPGWLTAFGLYDSTTEREWRGAVAGDVTWANRRGTRGLAVVGEIWSDQAIGRDLYSQSLARERGDRHLAAAAWTGSGADRLWAGLRLTGSGEPPGEPPDSGPVSFSGVVPGLGHAALVSIGGVGQLASQLGIQRIELGDGDGGLSSVVAAQLTAGGQVLALSFPGFSLLPSAWFDVESQFGGPDSTESFERHRSRLLTGVDLSSPWIGGGQTFRHYIELGASSRFEIFRSTRIQGDVPPALPQPEPQAPYQVEVRLFQSFAVSPLRLDLPMYWQGQWGDDIFESHLVASLNLDLSAGSWNLDLEQKIAIDTREPELGWWAAKGSVGLGRAQAGASRPHALGGTLAWTGGGFDGSDGCRVTGLGHLRRLNLVARDGETTVGGAWFRMFWRPVGLSGQVLWPLDDPEEPDLGIRLWLGAMDDFQLSATADLLSDGTFIGLVSLAQDIGPSVGPLTVSPHHLATAAR